MTHTTYTYNLAKLNLGRRYASDTAVIEHDPLERYFVGPFDLITAEQGMRVCAWEAENDSRYEMLYSLEILAVIRWMTGLYPS